MRKFRACLKAGGHYTLIPRRYAPQGSQRRATIESINGQLRSFGWRE
jgi:hypothetical protein